MPPLSFIFVLAFSAIASATNDLVDCNVTTDFQDPALKAMVLTAAVTTDNKLPVPYRGLDWPETFGVYQSTALADNINLHPNNVTFAPRIQANPAGGFTKPQQLSTILLQVTFHPDSLAQLIGGTSSLTGYGAIFDDFNYGLKKAPGSAVQCPRYFAA
ncbi:uncharacterized protein PG986_012129 [Apiospora aurea]|uniref:Uncharacterized protein n=1 Tax=Apiospora aurea TaxID=335848 RepID=A0ABR1PZ58_9PEZI